MSISRTDPVESSNQPCSIEVRYEAPPQDPRPWLALRKYVGTGVGALATALLLLFFSPGSHAQDRDYAADVSFALDELEKNCGHFFDKKQIDWDGVRTEFSKRVAEVKTDQDHLMLLVELVARLKDGHAGVYPVDKENPVPWPKWPEETGIGMFFTKIGDDFVIKNAWGSAKEGGATPGMTILKIDDTAPADWIEKRIEKLAKYRGFSTRQQAFFYATHWGLRDVVGSPMKLEVKSIDGAEKTLNLTHQKTSQTPQGPVFWPKAKDKKWGAAGRGDLNWCVLDESGYGYIHVRRCKGNLPEMVDEALAEIGPDIKGIVMDWRGNSGGGFDHDALFGRFIPKGKTTAWGKRYASAGPNPYGGPLVCIIDATCRSAGETGAGIFKEDGRAYMIGESPTAGMSSSKKSIELPSKLFYLYVSVYSNKGRFNGGEGIEGVGVIPHEAVTLSKEDLAAEKDTVILRAVKVLDKGIPTEVVPYRPEDYLN